VGNGQTTNHQNQGLRLRQRFAGESEATSVGKTPGKFHQVMAAPESLTKIHAIVEAAGSTHRVEAAASCCDAGDGGGSCQTART